MSSDCPFAISVSEAYIVQPDDTNPFVDSTRVPRRFELMEKTGQQGQKRTK